MAKRVISAVLVFAFAVSDFSFAAQTLNFSPNFIQNPSLIKIDSNIARTDEVYPVSLAGNKNAAANRLMIQIQDAHTNASAQRNIAKLLEQLVSQYGVKTVFIEGGLGDNSLSFLRSFATKEKREQIASKYLMKGELNGAEYLSLASDLNFELLGMEDRDLYQQGLKDYGNVATIREEALSYLNAVQNRVDSLKRKFYSKEILELDRQSAQYAKKEENFSGYYETLLKFSQENSINLLSYPNFLSLKNLKSQEDKVDFKKAALEQEAILKVLSAQNADLLTEAAGLVEKLRSGTVMPLAFYENVFDTALKENVDLNRYPALVQYVNYLKTFASVDAAKLTAEMQSLENEIFENALQGSDAKRLYDIDRHAALLKKLFLLQISSDEFKTLESQTQNIFFQPLIFTAFLNRKLVDLGRYEDAVKFSQVLDNNILTAMDFYRVSKKRDELFMKNALSIMNQKNIHSAVMIAGGYHTANLKTLMKEAGLSYAVVTPFLNHETNMARYENLLLSQTKSSQSASSASFSDSQAILTAMARHNRGAGIDTLNEVSEELMAGKVAEAPTSNILAALKSEWMMGSGLRPARVAASRLAEDKKAEAPAASVKNYSETHKSVLLGKGSREEIGRLARQALTSKVVRWADIQTANEPIKRVSFNAYETALVIGVGIDSAAQSVVEEVKSKLAAGRDYTLIWNVSEETLTIRQNSAVLGARLSEGNTAAYPSEGDVREVKVPQTDWATHEIKYGLNGRPSVKEKLKAAEDPDVVQKNSQGATREENSGILSNFPKEKLDQIENGARLTGIADSFSADIDRGLVRVKTAEVVNVLAQANRPAGLYEQQDGLIHPTSLAAQRVLKWRHNLGSKNKFTKDQADGEATYWLREYYNRALAWFKGTVVIGEGERDEAPMLYINERVGDRAYRFSKEEPKTDIALDVLELTNGTVDEKIRGSVSIAAYAEHGGLTNAPDFYISKWVVGPQAKNSGVSVGIPTAENLSRISEAIGKPISKLKGAILFREAHIRRIAELVEAGLNVEAGSDEKNLTFLKDVITKLRVLDALTKDQSEAYVTAEKSLSEAYKVLDKEVKKVGIYRLGNLFLLSDGDLTPTFALNTTDDYEYHLDFITGRGGAPEGVLAGTIIKAIGGEISARFVSAKALKEGAIRADLDRDGANFSPEERSRLNEFGFAEPGTSPLALKLGQKTWDHSYSVKDLVSANDFAVIASAVKDNPWVPGLKAPSLDKETGDLTVYTVRAGSSGRVEVIRVVYETVISNLRSEINAMRNEKEQLEQSGNGNGRKFELQLKLAASLYQLGRILLTYQFFDEAIANFSEAVALSTTRKDYYQAGVEQAYAMKALILGVDKAGSKNIDLFDVATAHLEASLKLSRDNRDPQLRTREILNDLYEFRGDETAEKKDYKKALEFYTARLERDPNNKSLDEKIRKMVSAIGARLSEEEVTHLFEGGERTIQVPQGKEAVPTQKSVYFFNAKGTTEGEGSMKDLLGGKGAGLHKMSKLGLPVPPGFTITTEQTLKYLKDDQNEFPEGLQEEIDSNLAKLEDIQGKKLGDAHNPLLVSVRSGAAVSMPGMMDTVLNLGLNDASVEGLAERTQNPRFAYDAYRRFIQMYGSIVLDIKDTFGEHLNALKKKRGYKSDTDMTVDDLKEVVADFKKIIQDKTGQSLPQDPKVQLRQAIEAVFRSSNNERAKTYREHHHLAPTVVSAVNVCSMVFGNTGDRSGTGVLFTRNNETGEKVLHGEFLMNAQGEDVVAGIRTPLKIEELQNIMPAAYNELVHISEILERDGKDMQDIEFTIEDGKVYMLQTRTGKRSARAMVKIGVDLVEEGLISKEELFRYKVNPNTGDDESRLNLEKINAELMYNRVDRVAALQFTHLATGVAASSGAARGVVVFNAKDAQAMAKLGQKVILVRKETSPDDLAGMLAAVGILTSTGGATSHAAVVAKSEGKPAVVGAGALDIDYEHETLTVNGVVIRKGEWITFDGGTGNVYKGQVPTIPSEIAEIQQNLLKAKNDTEHTVAKSKADASELYHNYSKLIQWANEIRTTEVWANADTPEQARAARFMGAQGIGLDRSEHMFKEAEKLIPLQALFLHGEKQDEVHAKLLAQIGAMQREDFKGIFREMDGLPVTIRLLDPPLHEFLPKKEDKNYAERLNAIADILGTSIEEIEKQIEKLHESNPMLGLRGVRVGILYPSIMKMQAEAIAHAYVDRLKEGGHPKPKIMVPNVILAEELKGTENYKGVKAEIDEVVSQVLAQENLSSKRSEIEIGTMIEMVSAALSAGEIAETADFFSFGTNDLTQMTFGMSRDDAAKSYLPKYAENKILSHDPTKRLHKIVRRLVRLAVEEGRAVKPNLSIGVCGDHAGDPASVRDFVGAGLNYVSAVPTRVQIAILASAQAAVTKSDEKQKKAGARLVEITSGDLDTAEKYWDKKLQTSPIERPYRLSRREDVKDIDDITDAEGLELEKLAVQSLARGEGYISMLIAGASSRMNTAEAPADVRHLVGDHDIQSKAGVPIGHTPDGKASTYLGEFAGNLARLFAGVGQEAERAGVSSNVGNNEIGLMSNDQYRPEHDQLLRDNRYFGLNSKQVHIFHQPLGPKFVARPDEVQKMVDDKKISEEAYRAAMEISKKAEQEFREKGNKEALVLTEERDPQGHGEYFHQLVASGELLRMIDSGRKWGFVRNVDNAAAKFDKVWLRTLGRFLKKGLDFQPEVSPRTPGQNGGSLSVMTDNGAHQLTEDPTIAATNKAKGQNIKATDSYWFNDAVAFYTLRYVINLYKKPGQSDDNFIAELRAASLAERQAIAERGRSRFPKILDAKPAKKSKAISVKVETNMWQSTGLTTPDIKIEAIGVRGARNFPITAYHTMTPEQKAAELSKLRFLSTKNWDKSPAEIAKAKAEMEKNLGRTVTDEELLITLETYRGNKIIADDLLAYNRTAELVTPGILGSRLSAMDETRGYLAALPQFSTVDIKRLESLTGLKANDPEIQKLLSDFGVEFLKDVYMKKAPSFTVKFTFRRDSELGDLKTAYSDVYTPRVLQILDKMAGKGLVRKRRTILEDRLVKRKSRLEAFKRDAVESIEWFRKDNELIPMGVGQAPITVQDAREGRFEGAPVPAKLQRQWIQLTGPAAKPIKTGVAGAIDTKKLKDSIRPIAYALLSGADAMMFDGEDALGQIKTMSLENIRNLKLGLARDPLFLEVAVDVARELLKKGELTPDDAGTLPTEANLTEWVNKRLDFTVPLYRARGIHLDDRHLMYDGKSLPASMVDAVLYVTNAYKALAERGNQPVLYLPKIQNFEDAVWWREVLDTIEDELSLTRGTIKVFVLVEQVDEAFQLMEIRAALGKHFVGFNTGRWDYINSVDDAKHGDVKFIQPDVAEITMTNGHMKHYESRVERACNTPDLNGNRVLWEGGMETQIPVVPDGTPEQKKATLDGAMKKAIAGKQREFNAGASGAWVAHWKMVPIVRSVWKKGLEGTGRVNQMRESKPLTYTSEDVKGLFEIPNGKLTEKGIHDVASVLLQYANAYLVGKAAAAIKPASDFNNPSVLYLMEDMATGEIRASALWSWLHKKAVIQDGELAGQVFTEKIFDEVLNEEYNLLRAEARDERVNAVTKNTTLPIARIIVSRYVKNEVKAPWLIDLLNISLEVPGADQEKVEAEVKVRVDRYLKNLEVSNTRQTANPNFVTAGSRLADHTQAPAADLLNGQYADAAQIQRVVRSHLIEKLLLSAETKIEYQYFGYPNQPERWKTLATVKVSELFNPGVPAGVNNYALRSGSLYTVSIGQFGEEFKSYPIYGQYFVRVKVQPVSVPNTTQGSRFSASNTTTQFRGTAREIKTALDGAFALGNGRAIVVDLARYGDTPLNLIRTRQAQTPKQVAALFNELAQIERASSLTGQRYTLDEQPDGNLALRAEPKSGTRLASNEKASVQISRPLGNTTISLPFTIDVSIKANQSADVAISENGDKAMYQFKFNLPNSRLPKSVNAEEVARQIGAIFEKLPNLSNTSETMTALQAIDLNAKAPQAPESVSENLTPSVVASRLALALGSAKSATYAFERDLKGNQLSVIVVKLLATRTAQAATFDATTVEFDVNQVVEGPLSLEKLRALETTKGDLSVTDVRERLAQEKIARELSNAATPAKSLSSQVLSETTGFAAFFQKLFSAKNRLLSALGFFGDKDAAQAWTNLSKAMESEANGKGTGDTDILSVPQDIARRFVDSNETVKTMTKLTSRLKRSSKLMIFVPDVNLSPDVKNALTTLSTEQVQIQMVPSSGSVVGSIVAAIEKNGVKAKDIKNLFVSADLKTLKTNSASLGFQNVPANLQEKLKVVAIDAPINAANASYSLADILFASYAQAYGMGIIPTDSKLAFSHEYIVFEQNINGTLVKKAIWVPVVKAIIDEMIVDHQLAKQAEHYA